MKLQERMYGLWLASVHWLLRHMPVELASAIGSQLVRTNVRINRPEILAGARRNYTILKPGIKPDVMERAVYRFLDNVGRMMAEFACLERIDAEGRVAFKGLDAVRPFIGTAPVLAIILHTGNWEVFGLALKRAGIAVATFYEPPHNQVERDIALGARRKVGFHLLTPDAHGVRDAMMILQSHGVVAIFGDEARGGTIMAPLFGRPPHPSGNLALAARLARKTNAKIVIGHCVRNDGCQFDLHISEPFSLPDRVVLADDIAELNQRIEPIILANLDRWYYLDDRIGPIDEASFK